MKKFKILVTDHVHPYLLTQFETNALSCDYRPDIRLEEVHEIIHKYHGIVINTKTKMNASLIDKAIILRFIARLGSGLDIIDLPYAKKKKIHVINSPEGNRNAVAEHALGLLLSLNNKLASCQEEVKNRVWDREAHRGREIKGLTIGIYGYGHTGSSFVKLLQGFDANVLVYDKYKTHYVDDLRYVTETDEMSLVRQSDIISFHLPLTDETHHLVNDKFLSRCREGVILINTSRGKVVKTPDLLIGLMTGRIAGACLDVFENEKGATWTEEEKKMYSQLFALENVVCSPHVAGWTVESKLRISEVLWLKLKDINWNK